MKKFLGLMLLCATTVCLTSCFGESSSSSRVEDDKYWESIGRERALRDAGMDGAANIERNARREYMKGGGYTSPDGGKQIHYKGSREQKEMLDLIDQYMN